MKKLSKSERMDIATEMVNERLANNPSIPGEARKMLILEVYKEISK